MDLFSKKKQSETTSNNPKSGKESRFSKFKSKIGWQKGDKRRRKDEKKGWKHRKSALIDEFLKKRLKEATTVPIPSNSESWNIQPLNKIKGKTKFFGLVKNSKFSNSSLNEMRSQAVSSPGNTASKVNKMKRDNPNVPALYMISAICTYGMNLNSSNHNVVLGGMTSAVKDAAKGLISDGISLYNCDNFFTIYYGMLDRLKRTQIKLLQEVRHDQRLRLHTRKLTEAMHLVDRLNMEKKKTLKIIAHLKKKLKANAYVSEFSFNDIPRAVQLIEQGSHKERVSFFSAGEFIAYLYALALVIARIPLLDPLVDKLLTLIPNEAINRGLMLRHVSINSTRNFIRYHLVSAQGNGGEAAKLAKLIFNENYSAMKKIEGQAIYQAYQCDPYFNLADITDLTSGGLFKKAEQMKMISTALEAAEAVIRRDMSKNHIFTEQATSYTHKLVELSNKLQQPTNNG